MSEHDGGEGSGSKKDKGSIEAKDGGISELKERSRQRGKKGGVWMREFIFVEMMDMRDAEVQRGDEDDLLGGVTTEDM